MSARPLFSLCFFRSVFSSRGFFLHMVRGCCAARVTALARARPWCACVYVFWCRVKKHSGSQFSWPFLIFLSLSAGRVTPPASQALLPAHIRAHKTLRHTSPSPPSSPWVRPRAKREREFREGAGAASSHAVTAASPMGGVRDATPAPHPAPPRLQPASPQLWASRGVVGSTPKEHAHTPRALPSSLTPDRRPSPFFRHPQVLPVALRALPARQPAGPGHACA